MATGQIPPEMRRAVAFLASRLVSGKPASAVYDYLESRYTHFSGTVSQTVNIYDHDKRVHITGSRSNLYHYGLGCYFTLNLNVRNFNGYDYGTRLYFSGNAQQGNVSFYDYGARKYFQFLVS